MMSKLIVLVRKATSPTMVSALLLVIATSGVSVWSVAAEKTTNPSFCTSCHTDTPMKGKHSGNSFGPTNLVATCSDCHGQVTDLTAHENNPTDTLNFTITAAANPKAINDTCLSCHEPEQLAQSHWTHNAHGEQLACSSCHQLHPANDPVRGITDKASIRLCVDCHSAQTLANEGELP